MPAIRRRTNSAAVLSLVACVLLLDACALKGGPRHTATVSLTAVHAALATVQDTEQALYLAGQLTGDEHQTFNQKLLPVLQTAREITQTVRVWPADAPTPPEVGTLAVQLKTLTALLISEVGPRNPEAKAQLLVTLAVVQEALITVLTVIAVR